MRPIYCDGNDCDQMPAGQHEPGCSAREIPAVAEDIVWETALEDGFARRPVRSAVDA